MLQLVEREPSSPTTETSYQMGGVGEEVPGLCVG